MDFPEARRRKDRAPDRFRTPQGPDMKYRLMFKCELCPYRTTSNLSAVKARHMNTCHDGAGQLPRMDSNQWFASSGKAEDFHWRCPLCRTGVKKVRSEISKKRIYELSAPAQGAMPPRGSQVQVAGTQAGSKCRLRGPQEACRVFGQTQCGGHSPQTAASHHPLYHAQAGSPRRTRAEVRGTTVYASDTLPLGDIEGISASQHRRCSGKHCKCFR